MAILHEGAWFPFKMDLGDPDHRTAFMNGEIPDDAVPVHPSRPRD
jgi:hypothetical protein